MQLSEFSRAGAVSFSILVALSPLSAQAATLSDLVSGGSLTEGDVVFDNFVFNDRFLEDFTGDPDTETPYPGDRPVAASEIEITTSSTAGTVSLTASIDPAISIADAASPTLDHIFEFLLDFTVSVAAPSSRQIVGASLGGGDLSASGDAVSEVRYAPGGFAIAGDRLEIFEAPGFTPSSATFDTQSFAATSSILFEGSIEGNTGPGGTAGLSTFTLTFDLVGDPPGPGVVPVPATLPLMLGALAGFGFLRRRRG